MLKKFQEPIGWLISVKLKHILELITAFIKVANTFRRYMIAAISVTLVTLSHT